MNPLKLMNMKKSTSVRSTLVAAMTAAVATLATEAQATLIAYEGFSTPTEYTAGLGLEQPANNVNGGTNWTSTQWLNTGDGAADAFTTEITGLSYTDSKGNVLATTDGAIVKESGDRANNYYRSFDLGITPTPGSHVWMSALVNRSAGAKNWSITLGHATSPGVGFAGANNVSAEAYAQVNGEIGTAATFLEGQTNFLVMRLTYNDPTSGIPTVDAWINPDLSDDLASTVVGGGQSVENSKTYSSVPSITNVVLYSHQDNAFTFDELRVGTTQVDVGIIPEPSTYAAAFALAALGFVMIRRRKA